MEPKNSLLTIALIVAFACTTFAAKMPDYIQICHRNDPKIAECVKNSVHSIRPHLADGIKELNVPAMEPLDIGDLNILEGGANGINVKVKKLNVWGSSNFEIKKIRASDDAKRFDFELILPYLHGEGNYNINGQILGLTLRGSGPFTGNFTNFYAFVKVVFDVKPINDVEMISLKELVVKIRTGSGSVHLQNLFGNDKTLGDIINETINQNFELFTNEVIQPIERALEKRFSSVASQILDSFTYNELFPL
ncbi:protein takeout [Zeugodacus cucurbitae]|uniref:Protein takeout n=1 Tax=Zeugodacus cucurbitae TaxID=28588 RepID=A0A0A1WST1_ZEUCU|nr:protein takeout [Zeugodacus cucurbitae]XP_028900071.1 protein takeout [Zeugodacus cucurbitae]XP_054082627.1 protein takeout [Zeugodacus cucurbitae]XP_054082636.1 protein takeout [Zeugodacus cucurbitae]